MAYSIKRMDSTGHTTINAESAQEAAVEVNDNLKNGYTAYLNGQLFKGSSVTANDLAGVDSIVLSTPIRGGGDDKDEDLEADFFGDDEE